MVGKPPFLDCLIEFDWFDSSESVKRQHQGCDRLDGDVAIDTVLMETLQQTSGKKELKLAHYHKL